MNKQETLDQATDLAIASVASKTTYMGATTVGFGWWFTNEAAVISGIVLGTLGLLTNIFFRYRADKREREIHNLKVQELKNQIPNSAH